MPSRRVRWGMSEPARRERPSVATRVRLSYRSIEDEDGWALADSDWVREGMQEAGYLRYLKRAHEGPVAVGDEWDEFVNCGCANPTDVIVRVEAVEGGDALGEATAVAIRPRRDLVEES